MLCFQINILKWVKENQPQQPLLLQLQSSRSSSVVTVAAKRYDALLIYEDLEDTEICNTFFSFLVKIVKLGSLPDKQYEWSCYVSDYQQPTQNYHDPQEPWYPDGPC